MELAGADLSGADLSGADLSGSRLICHCSLFTVAASRKAGRSPPPWTVSAAPVM
ncbi:pentapeptide repeat-containing protein [Streptacidiphilus sp. MAP12-20]|uniref:pentapeptide repeat-containing protein n=1 Tax=Streptacidiphilus sp. MAP12-20 TaxID=3156299 RepID=UPI00351400F6